jgi:hypothetical protein
MLTYADVCRNVPTTLLLMSRAFQITQKVGSEKGDIM